MGRKVLVAVVVGLLAAVGCDRKPDADKAAGAGARAGTATVVVIGDKGVAKTYLVSGKEKMAALEAFFPDYHKRPTSTVSAGWKAGYFVYFDFPDGESVKMIVSPTTHKQVLWSMGRGDHKVEGDFAKFLSALEE